jgi:hypothetical protein
MSGSSLGGGLAISVSFELGRKANLCTSENTFVCLVVVIAADVGGLKTVVTKDGEVLVGLASFSFSFPRPLRALKNP